LKLFGEINRSFANINIYVYEWMIPSDIFASKASSSAMGQFLQWYVIGSGSKGENGNDKLSDSLPLDSPNSSRRFISEKAFNGS
jgi:hypothetical protein